MPKFEGPHSDDANSPQREAQEGDTVSVSESPQEKPLNKQEILKKMIMMENHYQDLINSIQRLHDDRDELAYRSFRIRLAYFFELYHELFNAIPQYLQRILADRSDEIDYQNELPGRYDLEQSAKSAISHIKTRNILRMELEYSDFTESLEALSDYHTAVVEAIEAFHYPVELSQEQREEYEELDFIMQIDPPENNEIMKPRERLTFIELILIKQLSEKITELEDLLAISKEELKKTNTPSTLDLRTHQQIQFQLDVVKIKFNQILEEWSELSTTLVVDGYGYEQ